MTRYTLTPDWLLYDSAGSLVASGVRGVAAYLAGVPGVVMVEGG